VRRVGAHLLAVVAALGCVAPQGPGTTPTAPAAATPQAPLPQHAPQSQDPFATPDRSQSPWSQTPVRLIGVGEVEAGAAADGVSWRIGTARGTVWAWRPAGYRARDAGTCIYLHGYFTNVDQAVADHRLASQFAASGRNALFIVAEAPAWNGEEGVWPDLEELLSETFRRTGLKPPPGPVVVMGHSGAFRPILSWLSHPKLEEILLLDGLYRGEAQLRGWLLGGGAGGGKGAARPRRLVLVSDETLPAAEALAASVPGALSLPVVPPPDGGLDDPARSARLVHLKSQHAHMAIVESGEVVPVLLRSSHLAPLR
jgi:hypothetical protein